MRGDGGEGIKCNAMQLLMTNGGEHVSVQFHGRNSIYDESKPEVDTQHSQRNFEEEEEEEAKKRMGEEWGDGGKETMFGRK